MNMFADRLKEVRSEKGLTQVKLSEALGVSKGAVAMWETGKREPNYETLIQLSKILGETIDYMVGGNEMKKADMVAHIKWELGYYTELMLGSKGIKDRDYYLDQALTINSLMVSLGIHSYEEWAETSHHLIDLCVDGY